MQYLAGFLLAIFPSLVDFFLKFLTKKVAYQVAAATFFAGISAVFFTAISASLQIIRFSISDSFFLTMIYTFWPPHLSICISVVFSADISRWVYNKSRENFDRMSRALML
jgi:hypothetical protein